MFPNKLNEIELNLNKLDVEYSSKQYLLLLFTVVFGRLP